MARRVIAEHLQMPLQQSAVDDQPAGQPFRLRLISALAQGTGDADWEYPLMLRHPVALGVEEPIPLSPGVFYLKQDEAQDAAAVEDEQADQFEPPRSHEIIHRASGRLQPSVKHSWKNANLA